MMELTDDIFHFTNGPPCRQCGGGMQLVRVDVLPTGAALSFALKSVEVV